MATLDGAVGREVGCGGGGEGTEEGYWLIELELFTNYLL